MSIKTIYRARQFPFGVWLNPHSEVPRIPFLLQWGNWSSQCLAQGHTVNTRQSGHSNWRLFELRYTTFPWGVINVVITKKKPHQYNFRFWYDHSHNAETLIKYLIVTGATPTTAFSTPSQGSNRICVLSHTRRVRDWLPCAQQEGVEGLWGEDISWIGKCLCPGTLGQKWGLLCLQGEDCSTI